MLRTNASTSSSLLVPLTAASFLSISYSTLALKYVALGFVALRDLAITIMLTSALFVALLVAT